MTGFRDMSRIKKVWERTTGFFRRTNSQDLIGNTEQQAADVSVSTPLWRKKSTGIISGAAILLTVAGIIGYQQYTQYVDRNTFEFYHVYMNGQEVGTVESQDSVEKLIASETTEINKANPKVNMVLATGDITYKSDSGFKAVPETKATLTKLESMFTSHATGVEVKIDGKVVGIVKDQETADSILKRVQSKFAPELAAASKSPSNVKTLSFKEGADRSAWIDSDSEALKEPGRLVTEVSFVEKVQVNDTKTEPEKIAEADALYKRIVEGSTKPTKYVVQEGDCVGCIAQKFDISPQVIYENNPWIEDDKITIGDELDLTVLMPELTVRTTENLVELEKIAAPVQIVKNNKMRVGESKKIKEGVEGTQRLTYKIVKQNGYVVTEELVKKEVMVDPITEIIEKGTMVVLGEGTGRFMIPVKSYRITSKYGQRWGRTHKGIDFIGSKTIMASDSGIIEFSGTKQGLGKTITINHQNGYKTVYGHMSSLSVSKGDKVEKGDKIGVMGNTGNSTGTHLHFEIHKNGSAQNPLKYL
ncbi:M23 family metallopeptidase [Paenibacillus sp. L3-i20]|uniref:M23 family metallopeptidase n=1 Tax=Paenibacillus sp. L3-i20 TaxID=2905833 RepID=UPI001EE0A7F0|nr:M23 family metallopeptidase [Paenibacillus sp. L3-i20]GKU77187.1 peptidase M23 [Paenibacillus sp. L3-i20]